MDFKRDIEDELLTSKEMLWMYKEFRGFDDTKSKYLLSETTRLKSDEYYTLDDFNVTIVSNEPIVYHIHIQTVVDSMKS
jgi:hypothetical protein